MQTDHHLAAHGGSPIRPLTLGADGVKQPSHDAAPGSFIDLAPLTEEQKAAMAKALFKHKIGDAESCMLFVRAMEYELHTYREAAAEEAEAAQYLGAMGALCLPRDKLLGFCGDIDIDASTCIAMANFFAAHRQKLVR